MEKYLLTIEYRYSRAPRWEDDYICMTKKITIGIYDNFDDACKDGNSVLEKLESRYPLHVFPDGRNAKKERFSKHGGPFGSKLDLVTNMAYLKTPFDFYCKITTLQYKELDTVIDEVQTDCEKYRKYKKTLD